MNVPRFIRRLFRAPFDGLSHFAAVAEGRLYRCGQPRPDELAELIRQHGLKSVVSLRGSRDDGDPDAWEADERAICEARDVRFVSIPCNHKNPPSRAQADEFLRLCTGAETQPVLVHCRLGQQRTLLFCALYRVHVDRLAPGEAEAEMDRLGFGAHIRRHRRMLEAFRALAADRTLAR